MTQPTNPLENAIGQVDPAMLALMQGAMQVADQKVQAAQAADMVVAQRLKTCTQLTAVNTMLSTQNAVNHATDTYIQAAKLRLEDPNVTDAERLQLENTIEAYTAFQGTLLNPTQIVQMVSGGPQTQLPVANPLAYLPPPETTTIEVGEGQQALITDENGVVEELPNGDKVVAQTQTKGANGRYKKSDTKPATRGKKRQQSAS